MARNPVRGQRTARQRPAKPAPEKKIGPKPVIGTLLGAGILLAIGIPWLAADGSVRDEVARPAPGAILAKRAPAPPASVVAAAADEPRAFLDPSGAGTTAYASGDYEAALTQYQGAVETNPQDAESHSNLGQVLVRLNRPVEALPSFDRAIALLPERWAYHFNRARALGLLGRWEEAIAGYKRADAIMPDDYATIFNLGQALHRTGDEAGAVEAYLRAIALAPDDPSFRMALGTSYENLKKPAEAAAAYGEYLRLSPDAGDAEKVRARIVQLTK